MDTKRDEAREDDTSLQAMIEEFRVAQQRRLVERGMTLWNRTTALLALHRPPTPDASAAPDQDPGDD